MASTSFRPAPLSLPFTDKQIAGRAHDIFLREGSVDGNDQQNWFNAIEELTAERLVECRKVSVSLTALPLRERSAG
jgi:hypothetical protein